MINILCTSKPGDGLFHYSYEHCHYLNSVGIKSQVVVITHPKFKKEDYINSVKEKYIVCENLIFDQYTPSKNDICLIMGRSMLTLPYLSRKDYTKDQLLTIRLLVANYLISVYSENHPIEYYNAVEYFNVKNIVDLCDYTVYPEGPRSGIWFEKMINFSIYKTPIDNIKYDHLFLGTNKVYYEEVEKHIDKFENSVILAYREGYINPRHNHLFVPVTNLLGLFKSYVYTKPYFDPAPRLIHECKWLNKEIKYVRDSNIEDGGLVYYSRSAPTMGMYKENIGYLIDVIKEINEKKINR